MSKIPSVGPKELIDILLKAGFIILRQSGSHVRLRHAKDHNRQTTVPIHSGDIPVWLLREILHQANISRNEFLKLSKREQ